MQLRKLATAMLVMGMTAGLAQAERCCPGGWPEHLDKIAKNGVIVVGHRGSSVPSYYDNQQKVVGYSGLFQRHRRCHQEKTEQTRSAGQTDPGHLAEPYPVAQIAPLISVRLNHQQP